MAAHRYGPASSVVIYTRVSTEDQAREGLSLEVQRARCEDYARAVGLRVVHSFEDPGKSGRSMRNRPGLLAALEVALENRCAVLVYALDRLTRSVRDLGELLELVKQGRLELVSVTDHLNTTSASGRLVVHLLGAVAQWQREASAERVTDALAHVKASGVRLGRLPLGLRRGQARDEAGRLVVEHDAPALELRSRVLAMAEEYETKQRAIAPGRRCDPRRGVLAHVAERLNREGIRTPRGAIWRAETVRRVLRAIV